MNVSLTDSIGTLSTGWQLENTSLIHGWNLYLMKSYCYYCSWQDCVLSMSIVSLHSKNVALAKKKSAAFTSYISKKGHDLQADSSPHQSESRWKSSNTKPPEISSTGNMPQLWGRMGNDDIKSEMRGEREEMRCSSHKSGILSCTKSWSQLPGGPSTSSKQNLPGCWMTFAFFFFFKYKWNRFTCHVTWDNLCVSVCFSS